MLVIPIKSTNKYNQPVHFFGNKSRYDTLTDVVFLSDTKLVCADRQDKMLYLININYENKSFNILHRIQVPYNPDLMDIVNNTIYIVNLNSYITVCEIINNTLRFVKTMMLDNEFQYHGICPNPFIKNQLSLTSTRKHNVLTILNIDTKSRNNYIIPRLENKFLKDAVFVDRNHLIILGSDNGPKTGTLSYNSYIHLYEYNSGIFTFIDGLTYQNCHVDSVVFHNGKYYVTAQLNEKGYILNGSIEDKYLIPAKDIETVDFPHGLAISPSKHFLGFTSYSTSSLYILDFDTQLT